MGAYVNPSDVTKEEWLEKEGIEIMEEEVDFGNLPEGCLPVVLVDNGSFTAAGIAFAEREWEAFTEPNDIRSKKFFMVEVEKLHTVSPELKNYMGLS